MTDEVLKPSRVAKLRTWYGKYERPISSLSLIGGFVFDAVTLKRVDLFWENFWVVAHLVIVGVFIVLVHAIEKSEGDETNPSKTHFWLVNILQFFFGGILSTYLVFYFRSSDIAVSWPFLVILALAFWANEALKKHFVRLVFQISLFYLSIFSFTIFLVPVMLHKIGNSIFILAGILSLIFITLFLLIIKYFNKVEFDKSKKFLYLIITGIFAGINILYFTNLIPPIPLSLKTAGVYHSIKRNSAGNYVVNSEQRVWTDYFNLYPTYHQSSGEPVYLYTAIFSPSNLDTTVVHEWQYKDVKGDWVTTNKISLPIVGGRDGGFRTFSEKYNITPGHWRVNVLTTRGQVIGRVRFNIEKVNEKPLVVEEMNN